MGQESWSPPSVLWCFGAYSGRKTGIHFCGIRAECRRWAETVPAIFRRQSPCHGAGNFARNAESGARNASGVATYIGRYIGRLTLLPLPALGGVETSESRS